MTMAETAFEGWAILELMGHRTRPGYVKEVEIGGGKMFRIDIPVENAEHITEFYGCAAVYSLRPASEEIVRDSIKRSYGADPRPIRPVEYKDRTQLEAPNRAAETFEEPEEGDY
jgi:hypothetical protein